MTIRPFISDDLELLLDIWLRSVRATHTFLTESDIQTMLPLVRQALPELEMHVLCEQDTPVGFIAMCENKIEALFLAPEFRHRGGGRMLVEHVQDRQPLLVDVNEQNPEACRFYQAMGFVVESRSELDGQGQPFPLLHMRRSASAPMSANQKLKTHLERAFDLTRDLVAHLDEMNLQLDLPGLKSNRVAGQLWCIVGARESYIRAIKEGAWKGFSCSLKTPRIKTDVLAALAATKTSLAGIDFGKLTCAQVEAAFDLLEHELQHHGQLIRYVYANNLTFPASWNKRYTV
jgi:putative acetyltransferase